LDFSTIVYVPQILKVFDVTVVATSTILAVNLTEKRWV